MLQYEMIAFSVVLWWRPAGGVPLASRTAVFRAFGAAESGLLIATDVAARGLDLPAVHRIRRPAL